MDKCDTSLNSQYTVALKRSLIEKKVHSHAFWVRLFHILVHYVFDDLLYNQKILNFGMSFYQTVC